MTIENLRCYRCDQPGHIAAECTQLTRAANKAEHESRIAAIIRRWEDRDIDTLAKRRLITAENRLWYGGNLPASLSR